MKGYTLDYRILEHINKICATRNAPPIHVSPREYVVSCSLLINLGCLLVVLPLKALLDFRLSAAAILAMLGLDEAGFFYLKDGQHPTTRWIKFQRPTDEELLRSRLRTLHRAAKVSSHNRTTATARRPGYQRVKNTTYVFIFS